MWATKQWETQRREKNAEMHSGEMFWVGRNGYFYSKNILQPLMLCMTETNAGFTIRRDTKGVSIIKGERSLPRTRGWDQGGAMCIFISLKLGLCGKSETSRYMRNV